MLAEKIKGVSAFYQELVVGEGLCGGSCSLSSATFIGLIGEE